jgi:hypothetical protein
LSTTTASSGSSSATTTTTAGTAEPFKQRRAEAHLGPEYERIRERPSARRDPQRAHPRQRLWYLARCARGAQEEHGRAEGGVVGRKGGVGTAGVDREDWGRVHVSVDVGGGMKERRCVVWGESDARRRTIAARFDGVGG